MANACAAFHACTSSTQIVGPLHTTTRTQRSSSSCRVPIAGDPTTASSQCGTGSIVTARGPRTLQDLCQKMCWLSPTMSATVRHIRRRVASLRSSARRALHRPQPGRARTTTTHSFTHMQATALSTFRRSWQMAGRRFSLIPARSITCAETGGPLRWPNQRLVQASNRLTPNARRH